MVDKYLEELGAYRDVPIGPVSAESYKYLSKYWQERGRHPLFVELENEIIGFALIREIFDSGFTHMAEFSINPKYRRSGYGCKAVANIWNEYPGRWELQVHERNESAMAFWRRIIHEHAEGAVHQESVSEKDGRRVRFKFDILAT